MLFCSNERISYSCSDLGCTFFENPLLMALNNAVVSIQWASPGQEPFVLAQWIVCLFCLVFCLDFEPLLSKTALAQLKEAQLFIELTYNPIQITKHSIKHRYLQRSCPSYFFSNIDLWVQVMYHSCKVEHMRKEYIFLFIFKLRKDYRP